MIEFCLTLPSFTPSVKIVSGSSCVKKDGRTSMTDNWLKYRPPETEYRTYGKYPFNILTEEIYND